MIVTILKKLLGRNVSTATPTKQMRRGCSLMTNACPVPRGEKAGMAGIHSPTVYSLYLGSVADTKT